MLGSRLKTVKVETATWVVAEDCGTSEPSKLVEEAKRRYPWDESSGGDAGKATHWTVTDDVSTSRKSSLNRVGEFANVAVEIVGAN